MKKIFLICCIAVTVSSCYKYTDSPAPVSAYKPVLMDRQNLEKSIVWLSATDLTNPGKYLENNNFLYVVEKYKGVHVINNSNPASPQNIGFINVPGIQSISFKDNILYADNATDMVAMDVGNPSSPVLVSRIVNVLPQLLPPDGLPLDAPVAQPTWPKNTMVVAYVKLNK